MKFMKKLAPVGVAVITGAFLLAPTGVAQAKRQDVRTLDSGGNAAVDVSTELNCTMHQFTAKVKNKTQAEITPEVTLNEEHPNVNQSIEPGETAYYLFPYSGNNFPAELVVSVDTLPPVEMSQGVNCTEPVTFLTTEVSESAVVGLLRNNSTMVPQTVYTKINSGDVRVENLEPGESRLIAMPFTVAGGIDPEYAFVTIGTQAGYEGSYMVDLTPEQPLPVKK